MAWSLSHRDPLLKRVDAAVSRGNHLILWGGNVAEQPIAAEVPRDGALYDDQFRPARRYPSGRDVPSGLRRRALRAAARDAGLDPGRGAARPALVRGESVHPPCTTGPSTRRGSSCPGAAATSRRPRGPVARARSRSPPSRAGAGARLRKHFVNSHFMTHLRKHARSFREPEDTRISPACGKLQTR